MHRAMIEFLSPMVFLLLVGVVHAQESTDDEGGEWLMGDPAAEPAPEPEPEEDPWPEPPRDEARRSALMGFPVHGRVVQAVTRVPLVGIQITLDDEVVLSGEDGSFAFTLPVIVGSEVELVFSARDIDGKEGGGKHKAAKQSVKVVDGALPEAVEERGVLLELELK